MSQLIEVTIVGPSWETCRFRHLTYGILIILCTRKANQTQPFGEMI